MIDSFNEVSGEPDAAQSGSRNTPGRGQRSEPGRYEGIDVCSRVGARQGI